MTSNTGRDAAKHILDVTEGPLELGDLAGIRRVGSDMVEQARLQVLLFSQELDPLVYDHPPFLQALQRLALQHAPRARIRILLLDNQRMDPAHELVEHHSTQHREPIEVAVDRGGDLDGGAVMGLEDDAPHARRATCHRQIPAVSPPGEEARRSVDVHVPGADQQFVEAHSASNQSAIRPASRW